MYTFSGFFMTFQVNPNSWCLIWPVYCLRFQRQNSCTNFHVNFMWKAGRQYPDLDLRSKDLDNKSALHSSRWASYYKHRAPWNSTGDTAILVLVGRQEGTKLQGDSNYTVTWSLTLVEDPLTRWENPTRLPDLFGHWTAFLFQLPDNFGAQLRKNLGHSTKFLIRL